ncbi:MAG: lipopolysaccharide assembly protein LapB [Halopseudomonas sp.]|uniref:lipopolysaccharide assembly protein LapB n=1 Tax=Halopseudomonas sp. TaxID=2901191 RepID=UPI00300379D4
MQELVFLGLFVAALAIGWFLGRREAIKVGFMLQPHGSAIDRQYFIGLNYLLNEQPDEAIETFIRALEVNPETVETHIAIGKLFCQRGDVERAIKVHQNLLARPNLTAEQADRVQLELARDYLVVGMHSRAERLLEELGRSSSSLRGEALGDLVTVYEQQREWAEAVEVGLRLLRERPAFAVVLAHYYCEQAEDALQSRDINLAQRHLQAALKIDTGSTRALLTLAELEERQGHTRAVLKLLQRIAIESPDFVPQILPLAKRCADNGDLDLAAYLDKVLERPEPPMLQTVLARSEELQRHEGDVSAQRFLLTWVQQQPSIGGTLALVKLQMRDVGQMEEGHMGVIRQLLESLQQQRPQYRCESCGFAGQKLYWQCPTCHGWSSIRPLKGYEAV